MNRTTKALARLGTLAVVAGTVLGTPFAVGTAFAAGNLSNASINSVTNGTVVSNEVAAAQDFSSGQQDGVVSFQNNAGHLIHLTLNGTGAYFPKDAADNLQTNDPAGPAGTVTVTGPTTATATACTSPCIVDIEDTVAENVTLFAVDTVDASSLTATVGFNGTYATGCPTTGIDVGLFANPENDGHQGLTSENTAKNCVTQGTYGTPLTLSGTYMAGGSGVSGQTMEVDIVHSGVPLGQAIFSGVNTSTCTIQNNTKEFCTTDASGNISFTVVDNPTGPPASDNGNDVVIKTRAPAPPPATVNGFPQITSVPPAAVEQIKFGPGSVTPTRLDLAQTRLIAPSTQTNATAKFAEPGDVIQNTYTVYGACTPAAPNTTCVGTKLAGVSLPLSVNHGFFTPNCTQAGITSYAECSFATTPTAGSQVGNLTNSGTTTTVVTNQAGQFTVSLAIGRDAAFDNNGFVTAAVTSGSLGSLGDETPGVNQANCANSTPVISPPLNSGNPINLGGNPQNLGGQPNPAGGTFTATFFDNCPLDVQWTTAEKPLNGGTAKLQAVAPLASPNNVSIASENNYPATDSGTINVPDEGRVVFEAVVTDQFGNLTNDANDGNLVLTKTGPGNLWICNFGINGQTATNACAGPGEEPATAQPNGTFNQTDNAVVGSYLNIPAQQRYQVDTAKQGGPANKGYGTTTPSVNDGTTVVTLTWKAPTTTFAQYHAGSPTVATFAAGTATAQTDTFTLNFYNQLSQPVVTFSVKPASTVPTATAVTVAATVVDQFGNPIVSPAIAGVDFLRSGGNENSCVPAQNGSGGATANVVPTDTSGVAAYSFTCNAPGLSTISIVVQGPSGTQLASGQVPITFTGPPPATATTERPTVTARSHRPGRLTVTVVTHPAVAFKRVNIYKMVNGLPHLIGALGTNGAGVGRITLHLKRHHHYRIQVVVKGLGAGFRSVPSRIISATTR
jgi:hypothetical protein